MVNNSAKDMSSFMHEQENLKLSIAKASTITKLLVNINLKECPTSNLHECLVLLDDLLQDADLYADQCEMLLNKGEPRREG